MLTIERVRSDVRTAPTTAKVGIVGLAFAGLADVIAHLEASEHVGHLHQHTSAEATAHLAAFVSMVVIYLGVVLDGVRRTRAGRVASVRDIEGVA
jgi:hypothetical protein